MGRRFIEGRGLDGDPGRRAGSSGADSPRHGDALRWTALVSLLLDVRQLRTRLRHAVEKGVTMRVTRRGCLGFVVGTSTVALMPPIARAQASPRPIFPRRNLRPRR